mmetsp:Transcript_11429/g.36317  ORF Transcript_11429/g.36317 Transcript_11429/m.36317 type:complete len:201 (+) Transcript_11429:534-1136(+)
MGAPSAAARSTHARAASTSAWAPPTLQYPATMASATCARSAPGACAVWAQHTSMSVDTWSCGTLGANSARLHTCRAVSTPIGRSLPSSSARTASSWRATDVLATFLACAPLPSARPLNRSAVRRTATSSSSPGMDSPSRCDPVSSSTHSTSPWPALAAFSASVANSCAVMELGSWSARRSSADRVASAAPAWAKTCRRRW